MPIIEAQATGRIVLTSNIEPMSSIADNAAVLVNPYDIMSIRKGFEMIITDAEKRSKIIELGLVNVKKYTVENIATQYLNAYQSLIR